MDGSAFDQLSRRLASFGSRRAAIRAVAGAVVAAVAGPRAAAAQSCTQQYRSCQSDGQCCAGTVCQSKLCTPGCRIGGAFVNASTPQPGNNCARCAPAVSTTQWSAANENMACWSGSANLCGGASTCKGGTCQPASSITCQPLTVCHEAGTCNPGTGLCNHPPAAAGKPCGGSETCLGGFYSPGLRCNGAGACSGGATIPCAPYTCAGSRCRTDCAADSHCASGARCVDNACIYPAPNGATCPDGRYCASGHCVSGVCCDTACSHPCDVCGTGTCRPKVCNDGKPCTTDTCNPQTGDCVHTHNLSTNTCYIDGVCIAAGAVHPTNRCLFCEPGSSSSGWTEKVCTGEGLTCVETGVCVPGTGTCIYSLAANTCLIDGVCYAPGDYNQPENNRCELCDPAVSQTSWTARTCPDENPACLQAGVCVPGTGTCIYPLVANTCLIDGLCYAPGDYNQPEDNRCELCDPATSQTSWTDKVCGDDGRTCTADVGTCNPDNGACVNAIRADSCLIQNVCYQVGNENPQNACQVCDPSSSRTNWTQVACFQPACATLTCQNGDCVATTINAGSCYIDRTCVAAGFQPPGGPCLICDPASNQRDWTVCANCVSGSCPP